MAGGTPSTSSSTFTWPLPRGWSRRGREAADLRATVAQGGLVDVVGVGQTAVVDGLVVECLSLEVRESGVFVHLRVASGDRRPPRRLGFPVLAVEDDAGTHYDVGAQPPASSDMGSHLEVVVCPRTPDAARSLRLTVKRFMAPLKLPRPPAVPAPPGWPPIGRAVRGPWTFAIALPDRSSQLAAHVK